MLASRALMMRPRKEDKKITKKLVVPIEQENLEKCPVFKVHYLGKTPARGEYGREFIHEPVETLLKLRDRAKLPYTVLQITERGFHFLDVNGPFGKEKHIRIPIHHVCYGVADEQNPHVFAIIARTDANPENSLLECHAFLCDRRKYAAQITYWLLRTFLHVFEDLQRRRRMRQERNIRRQQELALLVDIVAGNNPAAARQAGQSVAGYPENLQGYNGMPASPTDSIGPDIYSITLEGSKESGGVTAVGLTKRPDSSVKDLSGKKFATVPSMRFGGVSQDQPEGMISGARRRQPVQQIHNSHESLIRHPPLRQSNSADPPAAPPPHPPPQPIPSHGSSVPPPVAPRPRKRTTDVNTPRPLSFIEGSQDYNDDSRGSFLLLDKTKPVPPLHHQQQEIARYITNPNAVVKPFPLTIPPSSRDRAGANRGPGNRSSLSSQGTNQSSVGSSARSSLANGELGFIFIEMLQEEFSGLETESSDTVASLPLQRGGPYGATPKNSSPAKTATAAAPGPLDQKLRGEDIEKRIREWLKRTSPDAEYLAFDDSGLDRISLAGTLGHQDSRRVSSPSFAPSIRSAHSPAPARQEGSVAGTYNHMPTGGEYF